MAETLAELNFENSANAQEETVANRLSSKRPEDRREGLAIRTHGIVSMDRVLESGTTDFAELPGRRQNYGGIRVGSAVIGMRLSEQQDQES